MLAIECLMANVARVSDNSVVRIGGLYLDLS